MRPAHRVLPVLTATCLLLAGEVLGAPPDSGTLINEQRQPGAALPARLPRPEPPPEAAPLADTGARVSVKAIRFTGTGDLATEAELQALVADHVGKELGFAELQALAARVTAYLREKKGYLLARAYLPGQDLSAGTLEIAIVAGRIDGQVRLDLAPQSRIQPALLAQWASRAVAEGRPARMADLERAVLLANDLPGLRAQASLEPGEAPGTTRVTLHAEEGPLMTGALLADNLGDRYTGSTRVTLQAEANDPSGAGDQVRLAVIGASDLRQVWLAYSRPLGQDGLVGNLSYTGLLYELGEELSDLGAKGEGDTVSASLTYPIRRSRTSNLWASLGVEYLRLTDEANGAVTRQRKLPVAHVSLTANRYDDLFGGGLSSASASLHAGDLDLSDVPDAKADDAAGPRAAGGFMRASYSLARLQRVTERASLMGALRGQWAADNLDSSQKFILGGPSGVRAYPVGEAAADEGHAFTLEARLDLPPLPGKVVPQAVAFLDTGWVRLNHDPWPGAVSNLTGKNNYGLSGAGLGLNVAKPGSFDLRITYAHTLGDNDGRSLTGQNSDNKHDNHRVWLQFSAWF